MITLHHLEQSRSNRILWLLEELGLPYEIKLYKRDPVTMLAPPELKKIHPLGKSPLLTDGEKTLAESSVIIEYLLDTYDRENKLRPQKSAPNYYQYLYYLHAAEGSLMPWLFLSFVMSRLAHPPVPFFIRPISKLLRQGLNKKLIGPNIRGQFQMIEATLAKQTWLAGSEFTAADIQMSYPLENAESRVGLSEYPHIRSFVERIRQRPAYQKAITIGGKVTI